jgi:hypothetical protein
MLKGLFLNSSKAQCSIYESGKEIYSALVLSDKYILDYIEIDVDNRTISTAYDFFIFNYHFFTMGWLDTTALCKLPGIKITTVLESLPEDPFILCPSEDFDVYCVIDPSMQVSDKRVYVFSRPLDLSSTLMIPPPDIPTIGTFGFATVGKGFERVVDAVNQEFEEAIVRINIPVGTYIGVQQSGYIKYLSDLCYKTAKKGIAVQITHDYLTKKQLINWCGQNTLNCFLYDRNIPGLASTTDQAISSGRPLAVSTNKTFRHIHQYITPYPERTLQESIRVSQSEVFHMQVEWNPLNFAHRFEYLLERCKVKSITSSGKLRVSLKKKNLAKQILKRVSGFLTKEPEKIERIPIPANYEGRVLIISPKEHRCGIHQYGLDIAETLGKSKKYEFKYCECVDPAEYTHEISRMQPDAIIYNYYPGTTPPYNTSFKNIPQLGIMHEVTQRDADTATNKRFDYHLCPDPTLYETNPFIFKTPRLIPEYLNTTPLPDIPTIGSYGFGFADKGFDRIIRQVQNEFDTAKIRFHIPTAGVVDQHDRMKNTTVDRCLKQISGSNITLELTHNFISKEGVLDFLAGNTVNIFLYEVYKHRGLSSVIDWALAVHRPIAINKCGMFRHIYNAEPSICIEDTTIKNIIANDTTSLTPFYNEWTPEKFIQRYENIIKEILK